MQKVVDLLIGLCSVMPVELKTQASVASAVKELEGSVKGMVDKLAQKSSEVTMESRVLIRIVRSREYQQAFLSLAAVDG